MFFIMSELSEAKSSGTTGEPFSFYKNDEYLTVTGLDTLRAQMIHGFRLTDKVLRISGERDDLNWFLNLRSIPFFSEPRFFPRFQVLTNWSIFIIDLSLM